MIAMLTFENLHFRRVGVVHVTNRASYKSIVYWSHGRRPSFGFDLGKLTVCESSVWSRQAAIRRVETQLSQKLKIKPEVTGPRPSSWESPPAIMGTRSARASFWVWLIIINNGRALNKNMLTLLLFLWGLNNCVESFQSFHWDWYARQKLFRL